VREVRNDDDLDIAGRPQGTRCGNRLAVARFEDELDVELGRGVVAA
jgi:hypothetical protein